MLEKKGKVNKRKKERKKEKNNNKLIREQMNK